MAKTKRLIEEDLKLIDIVIEIIDARIPVASRNPDLNEIVKNKKKIIILNKADLADENETKKWEKALSNEKDVAISMNSLTTSKSNVLIKTIEQIMQDEKSKAKEKGRIGRITRVMIIGIPNVGKSSLINRLSGKIKQSVGNKPGVTTKKQWIRIGNNIELLDTPGVLWPKFESEEIALNLAYTGTIKDEILDNLEIAYNLLKFLIYNYRENLISTYKITNEEIEEILQNENKEENERIMDIMYLIGRKRGAFISGGQIDENKTANIIIKDFREAKIGRITVERNVGKSGKTKSK
jgi:ribosome biogenesis GTPase A